jgi:hypothetical protein
VEHHLAGLLAVPLFLLAVVLPLVLGFAKLVGWRLSFPAAVRTSLETVAPWLAAYVGVLVFYVGARLLVLTLLFGCFGLMVAPFIATPSYTVLAIVVFQVLGLIL